MYIHIPLCNNDPFDDVYPAPPVYWGVVAVCVSVSDGLCDCLVTVTQEGPGVKVMV